jgi:uncharacterized alkaline shock family protein YloU
VSTPEAEDTAASTAAGAVREVPPRSAAEVMSEHGSMTIADLVVAKIVGLATREIDGVYALGGGAARMIGAVRQRVPGTQASAAQGVAVEVGQRQAAADIDLVVEYGVCIPDLAAAVRGNVINAVERICGLEVTEVNININDIHLPGEQDTEAAEPRVQ